MGSWEGAAGGGLMKGLGVPGKGLNERRVAGSWGWGGGSRRGGQKKGQGRGGTLDFLGKFQGYLIQGC